MGTYIQTIVLLTALMLSGCATVYPECESLVDNPVQFEECRDRMREWRRAVDLENWKLCEIGYSQQGVATFHTHDHMSTRELERWRRGSERHDLVRNDLKDNSCQWFLRKYWIKY